jgi:small conductance mechanosensitive channel
MLYFLQDSEGIKKVIPGVAQVKEKIAQDEELLTTYLRRFTRWLIDYAPDVLSAALVLVLGLWLIKRVARLAEKAMTRRRLEISLRTFLKSLISIGLKILLIIMVAGMLGIGTASFVTILGAASLAVGLALQGSLSNFAGGVLILIFKPFKVGDSIEAGGQSGEVKEIQIFNTVLLTADHKTVILPNGPLSNGTIVNTSRHGNLRVDVQLSVGAENDLEKVTAVISEVLDKNEMVYKKPAPNILIGRVADGAVTINVKPYCESGNTSVLTSDLYRDLKSAFEKNKITAPVPLRVIQQPFQK